MKIFNVKVAILIVLVVFFFCCHVNSQSHFNSSPKEVNALQWVKDHFARGKVPPFSFKYGGIDSKTFITRWKYTAEKQVSEDPNKEKNVFSYQDNRSGVIVKCFVTAYKDFPAVEWVLKFSNNVCLKYAGN